MEIKHQSTARDLSAEFSTALLDYVKTLNPNQKGNIITQLLRSGTSVGANISEAQGPESNNDFVHKIKLAYKEAEETEYWLNLQDHLFPCDDIVSLKETVIRIKQMLGKTLSTCAKKRAIKR